jgi:hypothetical protein
MYIYIYYIYALKSYRFHYLSGYSSLFFAPFQTENTTGRGSCLIQVLYFSFFFSIQ